ncbi:MAG TPA: HAD-IIA family hydrolase [Candidatus Limnocylindrales bacterium]|nr:HAD-IIA family hydrolase [Candidatus Limnocylindrales bacterium]
MLLLFDLDGVVYRGREPVPGMPALLRDRAARGDDIVYVTNNSRWHRSDYQAHLVELDCPVSPERVVTAARATALALHESEPRPVLVMVLGGPGLARELRDVGLRVVAATPRGLEAGPDVLVVGVDFSLSYRRLSTAAEAVRRGARFVATNRDPVYPAADGLRAGAGSIVAAVEVAAGRPADLTLGKPQPGLFIEAARALGRDPSEAVVVGDGLLTDIAAAHAVGARSVLMLTGVTTREQLAAAPADRRPTAVAKDARELADILDELAGA